MKTIKSNTIQELEIKKSKFICILMKLNSLDSVKELTEEIKNKYPTATHYCFAYIFNNNKKCSDDGEPTGTAGLPILNVLEKMELNHVICFVVRYFGGIKLGAGGLVRAYTKAVTTTLLPNNIIDLIKAYEIQIDFLYDNIKKIDYLLKDFEFLKKDFDEIVVYILKIPQNIYWEIKEQLKPLVIDVIIKNETFL